jgi:uncharacterized protein YybS (DUF2232 family)
MSLQPVAGIFLLVLPIALIAGLVWGLGKRSDFYENVLLSSGSVLLSELLYLKVYSIIAGRSAFDAVWDSFRRVFITAANAGDLLSMYHQMGVFKNFTSSGQLADFLIGQMKIAVPAFLLISSIVYGMLLFFIIRFIVKLTGRDVPVVPAFEEWALSRGMSLGLIILLLASFIGRWLGIANFGVVQFTVTVLISFLFTVLGLSVLWFFLKAGRVPSVIRWLLAILVYLIVGFGLPFLGMLDHVLHIRRNYRNKFILRK